MNQEAISDNLFSSQRYKIKVLSILGAISSIGLFFPNEIASLCELDKNSVHLVATASGLIVFISFCFSIRCPSCKSKLVFYALSNKKFNLWMSWLFDLKVCPKCGFSNSHYNPKSTSTHHKKI
ncbi:hypothetical protein [uncultured Deefgea sp.]|uniref:hypothetical protein n=1 Tax=uncultured Deefgea sp. TaxID=1304914 RepID=UPI0025954F33|nr:hypothetical protein [uncultured Deefgea sp.]